MDTIKLFRSKEGELRLPSGTSLPEAIVATVGTFDGVHRGHQALFSDLLAKAKQLGRPSAVITFDRPPVAVVRPSHAYELLNDHVERLYHFSQQGVDLVILLPFDATLANLSTEEFLRQLLYELLHVRFLVSGYDNRFGKRKNGETSTDAASLCEGIGMGFSRSLPAFDAKGREYSSSLIRQLLREGKVAEGATLLGYPYAIRGKVVDGSKLGRTLGFPTANVAPFDAHKLIPLKGVYAARATWQAEEGTLVSRQGMLYIGDRPTVSTEGEPRIEMNLFDFSGDLYEKSLCVELLQYVRGDVHFQSTAQLVEQLERDEATIRKFFAKEHAPLEE